jgi:GntR family histidine utilization transcriptional repressor
MGPNEWLLEHVPYTHGELAFDGVAADAGAARALGCAVGAPLLRMRRLTWDGARPVTSVAVTYPPGRDVRLTL